MSNRTTVNIERIPPQANNFERAVLGAMLIDKDAVSIGIEILKKDDFFKPTHQTLFRNICELYEQDIDIDQLTIGEKLLKDGCLDAIGGEVAIAEFMDETGSAANIEAHCERVKEKSQLRKILVLTNSVSNMCYNEGADFNEAFGILQSKLIEISNSSGQTKYVDMKKVVEDAHQEIIDRIENGGKITGITSGIKYLDNMTNGWQKSNMIVIGAKTSKGKTSLAMNFAVSAAKADVPIAVFSLEMSYKELGVRLIGTEARKEIANIHNEKYGPADLAKITDACGRLYNLPIFVDDTPAITVTRLYAKLKTMVKEHGIQLAVVDYIQLMEGTNKSDRRLEVEGISRNIAAYAKLLDIPIIVLTQFSNKADETDREPKLSDIRETGAISHDAHVVIFIHEPTMDEKTNAVGTLVADQNSDNIRKLIVKKNRNGRTGSILVYFNDKITKFENLDY